MDKEEQYQMEIEFTHLGHKGRIVVTVQPTLEPAVLGAREGALGLVNCTATIEFSAKGYLALFGWVQLVRSTDNASHGQRFEMDPFDPFQLYERAPLPYCWYGVTPTLFDAPSRDERDDLDWIAHSFLAASPLRGNRNIVTPLLGFSWGFHVFDEKNIVLKPVTHLTAADWQAHLPYLRESYTQWQFTEMSPPN
jgi:hypothetical protein